LLAYAKTRPDGLTCGTNGEGSTNHFSCALAARVLGIPMRMIPYKGTGPAAQDAAAGQIDLVTGYYVEVQGLIAAEKLNALAVFRNTRIPKLPDVPTFEELGYADANFLAFNGFYFPAKTPTEIVERFNAATRTAMKQPEVVDALQSAGSVHPNFTATESAEFIRSQFKRWKSLSDELKVRVE
jgi:tripartite-type tricarboxylate transporter receptor subunit TctC